ncbi:MAG: hypothetical protein QM754_19645 [Tepidisphaeraceae bacterium]
MADGARVQDIDAIRSFRASLVKFIEASQAAMIDAEGELTKRISWVEGEQSVFWQHNIRKLQDLIGQLKEQIRMKKLFKDSSGRTPSAFDEEKKLRAAQQKMAIAEEKLMNCRRWAKQLQREHLIYRGGIQRLQTMLSADLVVGVSNLDKVIVQIDQYLNAGAPTMAGSEAVYRCGQADRGRRGGGADESLGRRSPGRRAASRGSGGKTQFIARRIRGSRRGVGGFFLKTGEPVMGMYEGRGNLAKNFKDLTMRWQQTRQEWDDAVADSFEKTYLEPLEHSLRQAIAAMDQAAAALSRVRSDCE